MDLAVSTLPAVSDAVLDVVLHVGHSCYGFDVNPSECLLNVRQVTVAAKVRWEEFLAGLDLLVDTVGVVAVSERKLLPVSFDLVLLRLK